MIFKPHGVPCGENYSSRAPEPDRCKYNDLEMRTEPLYKISREPKTLELEKTEDGRYRLLITVQKLGALTAVEYFLDPDDARQLSEALTK